MTDEMKTDLIVNGRPHSLTHQPGATLLSTLRDDLGLKGSKPGCGRGECGACTMLIDGRPRMSCITLVALVPGANVQTIEGLAEATEPLRTAFADHGGFQCGFCTPGQIVSAHALLAAGEADIDGARIRSAMSGNICRCTGYTPIVAAIAETAKLDGVRT
jgi:aerobic-type carbon monoxide dehydrogenase small subunit (CoxS/CutS family)